MRQVAIRPNTIRPFTINLSTLIDHKVHDNRMGISKEGIFNLADGVQDNVMRMFDWDPLDDEADVQYAPITRLKP